jgi:cytokinin riboside 5'-monophosphate phosphoribohydrolase
VRLTIYTSSSDAVDERFRVAVREVAQAIGERGDELVYGGTAVGLMGVLAQAARAAGARVTGVLPRLMADRGLADEDCDELVVTDGMASRKQIMIERADAFVALPGGFGTLEELFEVLTLKQLGYHAKPIVLLDVGGFFAPLLTMFEHLYDLRFARPEYAGLYHVAPDAGSLFDHLDDYEAAELPAKWY